MTDKPSDKETDERFQRTLERLVGTPPKPHKTKTPPGKPRGGKGSAPE